MMRMLLHGCSSILRDCEKGGHSKGSRDTPLCVCVWSNLAYPAPPAPVPVSCNAGVAFLRRSIIVKCSLRTMERYGLGRLDKGAREP